MSNPKSPDVILARRVTAVEWPNNNPFEIGAIVAEVDTEKGEIALQTAQGLLHVAHEIISAKDPNAVPRLTLGSGFRAVFRVIGTASTDGRPLCLMLPEVLHEKIPVDLPLFPLTILPQ